MDDDREDSSDDFYTASALRPAWNRHYEHGIDILIAGIAGAVLATLIMWRILR